MRCSGYRQKFVTTDSISLLLDEQFSDYCQLLTNGEKTRNIPDPGGAAEASRSKLMALCLKASSHLRNQYPSDQHVHGDRFCDAVIDVSIRLTNPNKVNHVRPGGFHNLYFTSLQHALVDKARMMHSKRNTNLHLGTFDGEAINGLGVEDHVDHDSAELRIKLRRAVGGISADGLETFVDYIEDSMNQPDDKVNTGKYRRIAHLRNIAEGTAKSRVALVREKLNKSGILEELRQYERNELDGFGQVVPDLREEVERKRTPGEGNTSPIGHTDDVLHRRSKRPGHNQSHKV